LLERDGAGEKSRDEGNVEEEGGDKAISKSRGDDREREREREARVKIRGH